MTSLARIAALAAFAFCAAAIAQELAGADADFLRKTAEGGQAEIRASQIAQQRAASSEVKAFASQMIEDHTRTGAELQRVAAAKGVRTRSCSRCSNEARRPRTPRSNPLPTTRCQPSSTVWRWAGSCARR